MDGGWMEIGTILNVLVLSGLAGFGVYCASYAVHVWRARNASVAPVESNSRGRSGGLRRRVGLLLMVVGVVVLAGAHVTRLLRDRRGMISGEGLYAVRVPKGLEVQSVSTEPAAACGAVLARFSSPEREAKIASLNLKKQVLEAEGRITRE